MTEHDDTYGRGEVDDRIALARRTSADLDASVRAYLTDDDEPDDDEPDDDEPDDDEPDDDEPDDDEPDANDSWERLMWITHPPRPEPYYDGGRLRYD